MKKVMIGLGLALMVGTSLAAADCPNSNSCYVDALDCRGAHYASCSTNCYDPDRATCLQGNCFSKPFPTPNACYCRKLQ